MSVRITTCPICGEQTGVYEAGRIESVAANKCKCPPAPAPRTVTEERWVPWNTTHHVASLGVLCRTEIDAKRRCAWDEVPVRVTLTYTVPEGM